MPPKRRNDTVIKVEDGEKIFLQYSILFHTTLVAYFMFELYLMPVVSKLSLPIYVKLH